MKSLADLERDRESLKIAFEAAYRVGDCESEAWSMKELMELDQKIKEARARERGQ